ncbi:MAG: hypothetical protein JOY98_09430 [Candidatus Eremiobacteraeota bacterium]|nr:hypothetical protein [Candidatus Eremiobacteraeota bacterium]
MTAFETGRQFATCLAQGGVVTVSRDDDPASAEFAAELISVLRNGGISVEYLAVVSRPPSRHAIRSSGSAHLHIRRGALAVLWFARAA